MSISEELLMAYADGELNVPERTAERAQVEAALQTDPQLARRLDRHKALRERLRAQFDPVLAEPAPDRLIALVRSGGQGASSPRSGRHSGASSPHAGHHSGTVTDLSRVRAAKAAAAHARSTVRPPAVLRTWAWIATAASVVMAVVAAYVVYRSPSPLAVRHGNLVAQAALDEALSHQLASTQSADRPVNIGMSFRTKADGICRTFTLEQAQPLSGIACRDGAAWRIHTLATLDAGSGAGKGGEYRQARSAMPPAVRAAVEALIVAEPLDAKGEAQASAGGWK